MNGVVEVEPAKDETPEADAPTEEGKEEGIHLHQVLFVSH